MTQETLSRYDNVNPVILDYILNIEIMHPKIIDVGCWTGTLGKELRKNNFKFTIDGIDIDDNALQIANKECGYKNIYHADINNLILSDIKCSDYDIVVFGDVLEHVVNPGKLINDLLTKLSSNGYLIVSLPNIAFIKYRILHMLGYWNYTETGIMDKTHLHFFTLDSMRKVFKDNGLEIIDYKELVAVPSIYWPIKLLAKMWPELFALQIVFKLKTKN